MEDYVKVFSSNITRTENPNVNDLYELLNVVPATPVKINDPKIHNCEFTPRTGKFYIPKRKTKLKVRTVADIRKAFEEDTYSYLLSDLEKQESTLFKKIRRGSSRDNNTVSLAKRILSGDTPISRSTWQILINLNPENHIHPRQYVLWNGKYIQVNGSIGGNQKILFNYDFTDRYKKLPAQRISKKTTKQGVINRKTGLLRNSLAVKFKPGPLVKKPVLDESYQKCHIGNIELVDLPKPGLEILPKYGSPLDLTMTNFLNNMRKEDGTISQKWAEFAVSVLGRTEKANTTQLNKDGITFGLSYKYNKNRILMRRDNSELYIPEAINTNTISTNMQTNSSKILSEVEDIVNRMIDSVEISLSQDNMYTVEEEASPLPVDEVMEVVCETNVKDKMKRKFCELDRLDVTVIQLPGTDEQGLQKKCVKLHCSLGCICSSLQCKYNLKEHCGRIECMFDCRCDFSGYRDHLLQSVSSELMPGLFNLKNEINSKLAKEEQKFHQTVIVSGEKRILLKAKKRTSGISKKYAEFCINGSLKNESNENKNLSIVLIKLDCKNIEPWCMVHNLYKCFCKGKFTQSYISASNDLKESKDLNVDTLDKNIKFTADMDVDTAKNVSGITKSVNNSNVRCEIDKANNIVERVSTRHTIRKFNCADTQNKAYKNDVNGNDNNRGISSESESSDYLDNYVERVSSCARTDAYTGRKFSDGYYKNMNTKILEMEKNDVRLQKKLASLNNTTGYDSDKTPDTNVKNNNTNLDSEDSNGVKDVLTPSIKKVPNIFDLLRDAKDVFVPTKSSDEEIPQAKKNTLCNETKLVAWLESNYKQYKLRHDKGLLKNTLEPPKHGKVALHSWEFVLNRYRERKNLFLISKQKPYRIFMAVNTRNQFFDNCININDISSSDLHKYPQTIKNLVTNATDLKNNFCILRGLFCCWEVIGSVTKVKDGPEDAAPEINVQCSDIETLDLFDDAEKSETSTEQNNVKNVRKIYMDNKELNMKPPEDNAANSEGSSKWFVMTVENDFSEIRFFKKGFFVKYESIVNAIDVARLSGKTVRLSSKKCTEDSDIPPFGIYAIPNTNEHCVFIGPYEIEDTLGVETIKTILDVRKTKRTRGFWITTSKVDNLKVVENPLSFMRFYHLTNSENNNALPLENHFSSNNETSNQEEPLNTASSSSNKTADTTASDSSTKNEIKIVKPIKIRKTNGFYHLASDGVLKKITLQRPQNISKSLTILRQPALNSDNSSISQELNSKVATEVDATSQIKISAVFSTQDGDLVPQNIKQDKGMLILKPEEINRRFLDNGPSNDEGNEIPEKTTTNCDATENTLVISSDDEDNLSIKSDDKLDDETDVWITCTNYSEFGYIVGKWNSDNLLSFKLPGCEYSEYFPEDEAYAEINMELYEMTKNVKALELEWQILDSIDQIQGSEFNLECLNKERTCIGEDLKTGGFAMFKKDNNLKTYSKVKPKNVSNASSSSSAIEINSKVQMTEIVDLEDSSCDSNKEANDE